MNIVNKLTLRQLKMNKRRTLVTIIGVIISVAMITAVAVSISSALEFMKNVAIESEGNWHMGYYNLEAGKLNELKEQSGADKILESYSVGFVPLPGQEQSTKPYMYIQAYNQEGFEGMPVELVEGRLPANGNEIVIPETMNQYAGSGYKVGDTITVDVGNRYADWDTDFASPMDNSTNPTYDNDGNMLEIFKISGTRTYTVTGIIQRSQQEYGWVPSYYAFTYGDETDLSAGDMINAFTWYKDIPKDIYVKSAQIGDKLGLPMVAPNSSLLACYGINGDGEIMMALVGMASIVLIIIMTGSVSLIYNTFAISVSERAQYLGMLASVGATKKQKRNSVFFEGAVIGCISIPIGLLSGFAGMYGAFYFINKMLQDMLDINVKLGLVISPMAVMVAVLIAILTIFVSTYLPARSASKISAIEAIRQTKDVKISGRKVKTSKLIRHVFGIEGELALKNLKRNGRRYRATVFSLVISIILFLTTAAFSAYMTDSMGMLSVENNFDIEISIASNDQKHVKAELMRIARLQGVTEYSLQIRDYATAYLPAKQTVPELKAEQDQWGTDEKGYFHNIGIIALEDSQFAAYAKAQGVDISEWEKDSQVTALLFNTTKVKENGSKMYQDAPATLLQIGDKVTLEGGEWDSEKEEDNYKPVVFGDVVVGGIVTEAPLGVRGMEGRGQFDFIVSQSAWNSFWNAYDGNLENVDTSHQMGLYLKSDNPFTLQDEIVELQSASQTRYYIYNIQEEQKAMKQMQAITQILLYGFVILITAISVANIFNTISTSIALRKREFAMLRSMGMTPGGFNKMINFESIFYGLKALLYGLPVSFGIMYLMYDQLKSSFSMGFFIPLKSVAIVIVAVFGIVALTMYYSGAKVKGQNIIEGLKDTNL